MAKATNADVKKIKKTEPKLFEQDKVSSQNMEHLQKLISFCKGDLCDQYSLWSGL